MLEVYFEPHFVAYFSIKSLLLIPLIINVFFSIKFNSFTTLLISSVFKVVDLNWFSLYLSGKKVKRYERIVSGMTSVIEYDLCEHFIESPSLKMF